MISTFEIEKLISRLNKLKKIRDNGCWETYLVPDRTGYVRLRSKSKRYLIHRISAAYHFNIDIEDLTQLVLHKNECHNSKCWNPEHIYIGNHSNNTLDMHDLRDINNTRYRTHCFKGHEYTKENTIRHSITGYRQCRICRKNNEKIEI